MKHLEQWLYLETHIRGWGDVLCGFRLVKELKKRYPYNALTVVKRAHDINLTSSLLYNEGVADTFITLPDEVSQDSDKLSEWFNQGFCEKFDRLILGWCYRPPLDEFLDKAKVFKENVTIYTEIGYPLYQNSKRPIVYLNLCFKDDYESNHAWYLKEAVKALWNELDPNKRSIIIHPISTRKFSRFTSRGLEIIAELFGGKYNLIALGGLGRYYKDVYTEEPWLFDILNKFGYYIWFGLSPLKQLEIMKNAVATIISPSGAYHWATLYNIRTICIHGGEWNCSHWADRNPNLNLINVRCDRFYCNAQTRYDYCQLEPQCLSLENKEVQKDIKSLVEEWDYFTQRPEVHEKY